LKKPSWYGSIHYIKEKIPDLEDFQDDANIQAFVKLFDSVLESDP
jgi:hypothetical protein